MASIPTHSSPFPNALLDTIMPTLKDTEWRLLCVIVRQTFGFHDPQTNQRRQVAWLSHTQLKARTGRSSEAVSHAIETLVQLQIIVVTTAEGEVLQTPEERRRCMNGLIFRLGDSMPNGGQEKRNSQEACTPKTEVSTQKTELQGRQSENGKAKTTKETETKLPPTGGTALQKRLLENPEGSLAGTASTQDTCNIDDVRRFLLTYRDLFARQSARGESPPMSWERDGKVAKELLQQYGYTRLVELLEAFFVSEDAWVKQRGYALACFPALLPSLLMGESKHAQAIQRVHAPPVVLYSPSAQHWQQAEDTAPTGSLSDRFPKLAEKTAEPSAISYFSFHNVLPVCFLLPIHRVLPLPFQTLLLLVV